MRRDGREDQQWLERPALIVWPHEQEGAFSAVGVLCEEGD